MRIWYDHQIFAMQKYGGVSRYFCRLASTLAAQPDVQTRVIAPLHINDGLARSYTGSKIALRVPHVPHTRRIIRIGNQALTMAALAVSGPEVYHATYFSPPFRTVRHAGARLVVTVYDMIHERYPDDFPAIDNTAERKRRAVAEADQIICISERTREDLLHFYGVDPGKTTVIHLGFDLDIPSRSLQPNRPEPYLLYVGLRQGYKNFSRLLQVYARESRIHRQFKLLCFGGGTFTSKERQAMTELGIAPGRIEQLAGSDQLLASLYARAAAFIYPSLYEGFGIPPLEAMSMDCPVVCTDGGSVPEIVGGAGLYFDPESSDAMEHAILEVLENPATASELIARGRQQLRHYSWEKCASETLDLYRRII